MNTEEYAASTLRIGLALVFLYFGISQLFRPDMYTGYIPAEAGIIPLQTTTLVLLNGAFELFLGTMLALGLFTRFSALLLGLHLLAITASIGFTDIGVRDFGLSIATIALALWNPKPFSLDKQFS